MRKIGCTKETALCCLLLFLIVNSEIRAQKNLPTPAAMFRFNGTIEGVVSDKNHTYTSGVDKQALQLKKTGIAAVPLSVKDVLSGGIENDLTVQFWIKTEMNSKQSTVLLSQKEFPDKSLASQKNPGWVLYLSGGTWAWNMGSGKRRITHERDNGRHMPLNDGKWHQLSMTYDSKKSEVRLYYDGLNKAIYHVNDSIGFDFSGNHPLVLGWDDEQINPRATFAEIEEGAANLQYLVDEFNKFELNRITPDELESVVVNPRELYEQKLKEMKMLKGQDSASFLQSMTSTDLTSVLKARSELMKDPYTVHQVRDFMEVAPLLKIYSLTDGRITIRLDAARAYAENNTLTHPEMAIDNLSLWNAVLPPDEILNSYARYFKPSLPEPAETLSSIKAAVWNIHHGGIHNTLEKDGWDSRLRIAEMLKKEGAGVILMQETYSHGDFIAAELGYYFATTVDWDYLNQGTNISVLSRYPIQEVYVPDGAPFMNVACRVAISKTQDMYVMSNWYGMQKFPVVYEFHHARFQEADFIPTLFGGDFNSVPHTDGGNSPASVAMIGAGFTDAYRSAYPDIKQYPGYSHESGRRIDQLYYRGKGLKNTSTKVISTWPAGFPSDHFMIISTFDLHYSTLK